MKERPILFSGPMVRALLAGTKTQTRRALKSKVSLVDVIPARGKQRGRQWFGARQVPLKEPGDALVFRCRYGVPGDRLWVREAWRVGKPHDQRAPREVFPAVTDNGQGVTVLYEAGGWRSVGPAGREEPSYPDDESMPSWAGRRRPGMFMPRWASRITLEVTRVRVHRLHAISEADCRAEGILKVPGRGWTTDEGQPVSETARRAYEDLWNSINGSWLDCWVWVIEFRRVS